MLSHLCRRTTIIPTHCSVVYRHRGDKSDESRGSQSSGLESPDSGVSDEVWGSVPPRTFQSSFGHVRRSVQQCSDLSFPSHPLL
ncbi:hypothetical protein MJO28_008225 [Puccinia striiformis f. sp. tritici]|uniref:Uncharacterized protein n=1 Tax=Puccinia striiformis f. sp. tritici TaxID=168172 RepID=A0ACC0EAB5_9BASI|nr:hypothetical protein MJO28_008225 [Puccinia striiformis f. sp. tritici]